MNSIIIPYNDLVLFGAAVQIGILKRKRLRFKTCRVQAIISAALRSHTQTNC